MTAESPDSFVPFNDLARGTRQLRLQIDEAIARVLTSGWFVLGPEHNSLEDELSEFQGGGNTVLVGNGTDALQLALTSVGVKAGDSVLMTANAGGYSAAAARALGATPVFCDVDPYNLQMSRVSFESALAECATNPRAVVITHLYGSAADAPGIAAIAGNYGIAVVEDCAQSLGASIAGKKVGTFGDVATTSFYPTKNLGALGDGGAVFTANPDTADTLRKLRQYGWDSKYHTSIPGGINSRLDEMQAAILRVKLPFLNEWNERRRQIHLAYEGAIGTGARLVNHASEGYVGHLAVLLTDDRQRIMNVLARAGVRTDIHYPVPDHMQKIALGSPRPTLPITEHSSPRILSIPLFPELRPAEIDLICAALREF